MTRLLLVPLCLLAAALTLRAAVVEMDETRISDTLSVEPLSEDVWLYRSIYDLNGRPIESNGLVVQDGPRAFVIDTPWEEEMTGTLLDWVEREVGPVAGVVATHFHGDRLGGIDEVHRRGIESYGHTETARLAIENELTPPETTFDSELDIAGPAIPLELFYPGPGHTPDNIVVWLPQQKLLFGGCLLKTTDWSTLGYLGDAVVDRWPATLEVLLERYPDAEVVIPGHGVLGDLETVRHTRDLALQHLAREIASPSARPANRER